MREELTNRMKKEMWEGLHFKGRIVGSGEVLNVNDEPPNSWIDSTSKVKTVEGQGVGVCSLVCNTSRVKGRAKTSGWGLRQMTSKSINHMDLKKLTNKLFNVQL